MLRIIAGEYGGRRLRTLRGMHLRPTSDQLRETLFNIIGPRIVGARFLDAYAGSGAVGLEALSRGAAHVTFIERHRPAVECVRSNLLALEINERFSIIQGDVVRALLQQEEFDICFLDPPYAEAQEYEKALTALGRRITWPRDALVIAEHSKRLSLTTTYGSLKRVREKTQGDSRLSFYQPQIPNPGLR
ncbi:MAG: 16S rRNA (guanine(966)-N(2))-methyltransferase RsmD [Acidobacteriia bacterium]|nr:16S rRNA (guanine(966)-N(2))-methyltransferase RsmD [Terriglobia bacterium]